MSEASFTREDDFDKDFTYALFDDYMELVEAGELTREEALEMYRDDYARMLGESAMS